MEKTKILIKMAKEIYEKNNDFEPIARTFGTLKELCDEFLQTPYEGAMLVMRGNIKPEKKYVLYVVGFDDYGNDAVWGFETLDEYCQDIMTPETEDLIIEEYKRVFPGYKKKKNYKEYIKNK
jgi:hypothetical protein